MKYNIINAIVYDYIWRFLPVEKNDWLKPVAEYCHPDWVLWKTERTMRALEKEEKKLKEHWQAEENAAIVEKFQERNPDATVTTHNEETGAVLIEHPADGSSAQDTLGGTMEIKSPWSE